MPHDYFAENNEGYLSTGETLPTSPLACVVGVESLVLFGIEPSLQYPFHQGQGCKLKTAAAAVVGRVSD